jgi:hypothetical protein
VGLRSVLVRKGSRRWQLKFRRKRGRYSILRAARRSDAVRPRQPGGRRRDELDRNEQLRQFDQFGGCDEFIDLCEFIRHAVKLTVIGFADISA